MAVTVSFSAVLKRFDAQGEKTGWTYIEIPASVATQLLPGNKKSFRVKGKLDSYSYSKIALMPMGNGDFIMPLKAAVRKGMGKQKGASVLVTMQLDKQELELPADFAACLHDEPQAWEHFQALPKSHQHYFIRWVTDAKTDATKAKRIAQCLAALGNGLGFAEMIRSAKNNKADW